MFRRHFGLFVGITVVPQLLSLLFELARGWASPDLHVSRMFGQITGTSTGLNDAFFTIVGGMVTLFVHSLLDGAIIVAVARLYLGHEVTISQSLRLAWARIGTIFAATLLNALAVGGGFIALIIPGLLVLCRLAACLPPVILEGASARGSLSRSWKLTKGYAGRFFALYLMYLAVAIGFVYLRNYPIRLILAGGAGGRALHSWQALQLLLGAITSAIVAPPFIIAFTIYYFDLRVRKEGFDLQLMMDPAGAIVAGG